jgi:hypothetical protein
MHHLVDRGHFQVAYIVEKALEKVSLLADLAVRLDKTSGSPSINAPISPPYDLTRPMAIAYLIGRAAEKVGMEPEQTRDRLFGEYLRLNETVYRHLRKLGETTDFGPCFLLWQIIGTIKQIIKIYLYMLRAPISDEAGRIRELLQQVQWYQSFFWATFSKANTIHQSFAEEASDALAWIGLSFLDARHLEVAKRSVENIASIANNICRVNKTRTPYEVANVLIDAWKIRLLAELRSDSELVDYVDGKVTKPPALPVEEWPSVAEEFERAKERLQEELSELNLFHRFDIHKSTGLLIQLLEQNLAL